MTSPAEYLHTEPLQIQLVRVRGTEFEPLSTIRVPLASFVEEPGTDAIKLTALEFRCAHASLHTHMRYTIYACMLMRVYGKPVTDSW